MARDAWLDPGRDIFLGLTRKPGHIIVSSHLLEVRLEAGLALVSVAGFETVL